MKKGAIAVLVSVWVSVAGTGIGLAALINVSTGRLDSRISELDTRLSSRISDLAEGQAELRERMTRVETILGEVRTLAAVQAPDDGVSANGTAVQGPGSEASGSLR